MTAAQRRQLVLIPADPVWRMAQAELASQLQQLGLLGKALDHHPHTFMTGDNFLQQFSFMGCAPSLAFAPIDPAVWREDEFVYVHLHDEAAPRWFGDTLLGKPACPHCGKRIPAWQTHFDEHHHTIACPQCARASPVCAWRWFDAGGCASQFISIVNVYPKESIPTDTLLQELSGLWGVTWTYFYLHAPLLDR